MNGLQTKYVSQDMDALAQIMSKASDESDASFPATLTTFGNVDVVGDVIVAGALDEWYSQEKDNQLPMLSAHDMGEVIGYWDEFKLTKQSLTAQGTLYLSKIQKARETAALIEMKAVDGVSIGFQAQDWEWADEEDEERGYWGIDFKQISLHESSVVLFPANPKAGIAKSRIIGGKSFTRPVKRTKLVVGALSQSQLSHLKLSILEA